MQIEVHFDRINFVLTVDFKDEDYDCLRNCTYSIYRQFYPFLYECSAENDYSYEPHKEKFISLTSEYEHRDCSCNYEAFDLSFIYELVMFMD